jgi:hypothetical protein
MISEERPFKVIIVAVRHGGSTAAQASIQKLAR